MNGLQTYSGIISKVKSTGLIKEGIFQPIGETPFRFRARALPNMRKDIILQGQFTPDRFFVVKRYYLTSKLEEFLPGDFIAKHRKAVYVVSRHLDDGNIRVILENPDILYQWLGKDNFAAAKIRDYVKLHYTIPNLLNYFHRFALSQKKINEIYEKWGVRAVDIIDTNPYALALINSIPFNIADILAQEKGIPFHSQARIRGAIQYVYSQYVNSGSSYLSLNEFQNRVYQLIGKSINKEKIQVEIEQFAESEQKQIIRIGHLFYDRHLFFAEIQIAQRLADLTSWIAKQPKNLHQVIADLVEQKMLPELDRDQVAGIEHFFACPILLVQGEAGTGKTRWIAFLLSVLKTVLPTVNVKLAAPTGKAARRMTEITGYPAQTIHSLLGRGIEKNSRILYHYKKNPINTDVLIIDEASMVNEYLWRDMLWSVERGTKIVFVGDPNQLEPIGPGRPFADMIKSGFPTVTLRKNYRNDSAILDLAKAILQGEIDPALLEQRGIKFIPCETIAETKEKLIQVYEENERKYPIISMYREEFSLGIDQLNPFMKQQINPAGTQYGMGKHDPVIQIRNTPKVDNGEVGIIQDFRPLQKSRITFGLDKEVTYTLEEMLDNLELAYAITTTKTQGSQYEGVIIPLIDINQELPHRHSMWYKNSLYTAVTRAQKELVLIGDLNELFDGVKRKGTVRRTQLLHRIQSLCGKEESFSADAD